jgi:hypothetical protein
LKFIESKVARRSGNIEGSKNIIEGSALSKSVLGRHSRMPGKPPIFPRERDMFNSEDE